jgi:hypothetical protein
VALTDAPLNLFVTELAEIYPEAKVVLVERDPNNWWRSVMVLFNYGNNPLLPILAFPVPGLRWFPYIFQHWKREGERLCKEAGRPLGPGKYRPVVWCIGTRLVHADGSLLDYIREHSRRVKASIPKDRLLVMKLGDGWEPLCKFLGKPVPENEPFPRLNDAEYADKMAVSILTGLIIRWAFILSTTITVPFASYWAYKHYGF